MLTECTTADDGVMNEAEFAEACLKHCSKQDTFAMRLYAQTIASSSNSSPPKKTTSIRTLACILTLQLLQLLLLLYYTIVHGQFLMIANYAAFYFD